MQDTKTVKVNQIPIPEYSEDEIRVKIASASLCHSDLLLINGSIPGGHRPVTMGHEGVGYVESVGANIAGFSPGDRIGFLYIKGCCCE
jgi:D-arabinose 1-dehydrogenase-like Zn-dependent alcohol dehydrogenase